MKKTLSFLFSIAFTSILLIIFAISIGYATFIENDFGSAAARAAIYNAKWFEFLLLLLCVNMIGSLIKYKVFKKRKWSIILFHIAFIIMIIGSAITRYWGFEGTMHIREGASANFIKTFKASLTLTDNENLFIDHDFDEMRGYDAMNDIDTEIDGKKLHVSLVDFIPNASQMIRPVANGKRIISIVTTNSKMQYQKKFLSENETFEYGNITYSFGENSDNDINFYVINDSLFFKSKVMLTKTNIKSMFHETIGPDTLHMVLSDHIYQTEWKGFIVKKFYPSANIEVVSMNAHPNNYPLHALKLNVKYGDEEKNKFVFGASSYIGENKTIKFKNKTFEIQYGSQIHKLPFQIRLEDFKLNRYANSNSPSSYISDITLLDSTENIKIPYSIFMNNVLNYKGYRFFQSSFDKDEKGTILSVNHDPIGTFVSYLGYLLMTLGMFFALFSRKSYFRELLKKGTKSTVIILLGLMSFITVNAQNINTNIEKIQIPENKINKEHAKRFGKLLIADPRGRIKPINTFASEITRKIMREKSLPGYTPTELFHSMLFQQNEWYSVPIIKASNKNIQKKYNFNSKKISYLQLFEYNDDEAYILSNDANTAFTKSAKERSKYDKEIIKLDERANLCMMIFKGQLLHIFPKINDTTRKWTSATISSRGIGEEEHQKIYKLYSSYQDAVKIALQTGKWEDADFALENISNYQKLYAKDELPSNTKINAEIFYNNFDFFNRVKLIYLALGLLLLIFLFIKIFNEDLKLKWVIKPVLFGIILLFILHTTTLALRWYISGHAPWSNGYETILFVAWATVLAGMIFVKRSPISLSITAILAAILILISGLSWMDPDITNLVPVLKSYWLIIHVAVIVSSYGFFALSALMGILNLLIISFTNKKNKSVLTPNLKELSSIIEMANIIGLYLLTIGTFLGAVWANESWGRYWGWDPKETWALVTIIVYTIVGHLRHIPGMKSEYIVSTGAVIGLGSVLMTYFGVNYFLSGMHSYAAGDSFDIPLWSKLTVAAILSLIVISGIIYKKNNNQNIM